MYSILLRKVRLIDGTGALERVVDIAIEGDEIVAVDENINARAVETIDGGNLVCAPGFIDVQNHSDSFWQLFDNPLLPSLLLQGFTTVLVGQCGASLAPLFSQDGLLPMQKWHNLSGVNGGWQSFAELAELISHQKLGINVASLVGYATLRRGLVKDSTLPLDTEQQKIIASSLMKAFSEGAFGLSSGLSYSHEAVVSELELFDVVKIVKNNDRLFSLHLRSEGSGIEQSVSEAVDMALHSGVRMKISHFKVKGASKQQFFKNVVSALDTAKHQGADISFDLYPYTVLWQAIHTYLPKWAMVGGRKHILDSIHDSVSRNKVLAYLNSHESKIKELVIASTANKLNVVGKPLSAIAAGLEISAEQALLELIENGGSEVMVFDDDLDKDHVESLLSHPLSLVATDGAGFSDEPGNTGQKSTLVHPRCFGTVPRFFEIMKRTKRLSLPEMVKKLTSKAARVVGIKDRGVIAPNYKADIVLFDEVEFVDTATVDNPYQYAKGVKFVIVNGKIVLKNGEFSGETGGRFLKKNS